MPLKKQFLKTKPEVKVTFEIGKEAANNADKIFLMGEFNDWKAIELTKLKKGSFKTTMALPTDGPSEFQFKYQYIDKSGTESFENEWQADSYLANEFGQENSVVSVVA